MEKEDIINWYNANTNCKSCENIINYMIDNKIISEINKDIIDDFLLKKKNNNFIIQDGHYLIKENRINFINNHFTKNKKVNKYKLNLKNKNNIKLIKLN